MSLAKTLKFGEQLLLWGDGGGPEIFSALCGFTSLELAVNVETESTNVPDCEDPDLPAWLVSSEVSKQMQLGGSGVIDTDVLDAFNDWILEGGEKNFRWMTAGVTNQEANGYWQAPGILSAYGQTGERGQLWNHSTTILLNGAPERVIAGVTPFPTVAPVITGTTEVGETLTVSNGTWTNSPLSYGRQWYRSGTPIDGETGATYELVIGDEGETISAKVTATNASGSRTASAASVGPITSP